MHDFAEETTLHGLPKVIKSKSTCKRVVWLVLFTCSLIALLLQASELLGQFASFRKSVSINVDQSAVEFPAVTICSENGVRLHIKEAVARQIKGYDLLDAFNTTHYNMFNSIKVDQFKQSDCVSPECVFIREYLKWFSNTIKTAATFSYLAYKLDGYLLAANLGVNVTSSAGVRLQDMLYVCEYNGEQCDVDDFVLSRHPRHLLCYTFKKETTAKFGQQRGLRLVLKHLPMSALLKKVNGLLGMGSVDRSPGFRVSVHPRESLPFSEDAGSVYSPGVSASLGFTKTVYERIGKPYGNCTDKPALSKNNKRYTSLSCLAEYQQDIARSRCNCTDISLPHTECELHLYPYCRTLRLPEECNSNASFWNQVNFYRQETLSLVPDICRKPVQDLFERIECMNKASSIAYTQIAEQNSDVNCYPPCKQIKYEVRDSEKVWPSYDGFYQTLAQMITDRNSANRGIANVFTYMVRWADNEQSQSAVDGFRSRFVQIDVHLRDPEVTTISEHVTYEWYQMLSEFGGLVGLYIGMSVMTLCEMLELLFMKIYNLCFIKFSNKTNCKEASQK